MREIRGLEDYFERVSSKVISIFHGASLQSKDSILGAKNLPPLKSYKSVAVNSLSSKYSILTLPPIYYVTRAEEFRTV